MKLLFITDLYPVKECEKTTPKTLLNFVKNWQESGVEVDVIKPNFILNSFLRRKPFYKTGQYGNVFNVNYWTPFWFNIKNKFSKSNLLIKDTLVVAHMPSGILFADKLGLPFVAGIHQSDIDVLTKPLYKFYFAKRLKRSLENAKLIACRSYVLEKKLLKLYPEFEGKTFVAPSGIDEACLTPSARSTSLAVNGSTDNFADSSSPCVPSPSAQSTSLAVNGSTDSSVDSSSPSVPSPSARSTSLAVNGSTDSPADSSSPCVSSALSSVVTCANFKKRKNIDKLIKACYGKYQLTIIGDGKERRNLEKLDKNVKFTGWLKPEEVYKKMRECKVFVLPSTGETFGMVYLEAMAQGCITVCTKNDGIDGIIKDGENGFLTEPTVEGIKNVLDKINSLTENERKILVDNTFKTINNYTSKKCSDDYLQQILKIL